MRFPRIRFTLLRMMAVVVIAGVGLAVSQFLAHVPLGTETPEIPRILETSMHVPSPIGTDGRERILSEEEWAALLAQMSSPEVLDAALADPRIARLPYFAFSPSKRSTLASCYAVKRPIGPADQRPVIYVRSPVANLAVYQAVTDAILARGPKGITNIGDSYRQFPERFQGSAPESLLWGCDGKNFVVLVMTLLAILLVLCLPARGEGNGRHRKNGAGSN